jgi:antitoxin HigA-1
MRNHKSTGPVSGNPNRMLDTLIANMRLEDDSALARRLKMAPPIVTMLREGRIAVSPSMLRWMHEASGMSIQELSELLEDERATYRLTCK